MFCGSFVVQVVLGSSFCELSTGMYWEALCASFEVQSSTQKWLVQSFEYKAVHREAPTEMYRCYYFCASLEAAQCCTNVGFVSIRQCSLFQELQMWWPQRAKGQRNCWPNNCWPGFFSLPRTESKRTCRIWRFTLRLEPLRTITLTRQFGFFSATFTFLAFAFGFVLCASQVDSFEVGCAYHVLYEASCIRVCSDTSCLVCVVFSPCLNVLPILTLALPLAASRGRRIYVIYVSIYLP